jgi:hypothetical protein
MSIADYVPQEFVNFFSAPGFQEAFIGFTKYLLNENNEFRETVKSYFEECLVFSEYKPVQDITKLKKITGLVKDEDEERELNIPERIEALEEKIVSCDISPCVQEQVEFTPETKTEKTVFELAKFASSLPILDGKKAITPKLFHHFRQNVLPPELRPKTVNPRQWKKDISDKMIQLFDGIKTDKKGNNRGVRLVFPKNFSIGMLKCKSNVS